MPIAHEPPLGRVYRGKFFIALARNGAGFIAAVSKRGAVFTPDPLEAKRWRTRAAFEAFVELGDSGALHGRDFKLIACTDELRVGPKPPPDLGGPILGKPKAGPKKRKEKNAQSALAGL